MSNIAYGITLTATSGLCTTALLALTKVLQQQELPYYRLSGVGLFVMMFTILYWLVWIEKIPFPRPPLLKWVLLRGLFGVGQTPAFLAVRAGAPVGDVTTLTSTNIAVAALLGRLLLGERFTVVQGLALICSLLGAVLVCRPSFIFPSDAEEVPMHAYLMALGAGFSRACVYLTVRKAPEVHSLWFTVITMCTTATTWWVLAQAEIMADYTLDVFVDSPHITAAWCAVLGGLVYIATAAISKGSQYCPAGVTATVSTGTSMVSGYIMQAALFGTTPSPITAAGAGLMTVGMAASAFAARTPRAPVEGPAAGEEPGVSELASWAADEFTSGLGTEPLRRRPAAQGAAAAGSAAPVAVGAVTVALA